MVKMIGPVGAGNVNTFDEWTDCCWPYCNGVAEGGGPPLCEMHFTRVGKLWLKRSLDEMAKLRASIDHRPTAEQHARDHDAAMVNQSQVYYVRIGDHVKIGFSTNMRARLTQLRVDDDALLATEPGGPLIERQRHQEFAAERVGRREHFNPSRRLLAHIDQLRAEGEPVITTYKTALRTDMEG